MARLIPKLRKTNPPPAPPPRAFSAAAVRVSESFSAAGYTFREGDTLSPQNALVQQLRREHPSYFELAP